MGWRLEPEPTMSSLEGSLIREIGARNLLGTAAPESIRALGTLTLKAISGIKLWRFEFYFFL